MNLKVSREKFVYVVGLLVSGILIIIVVILLAKSKKERSKKGIKGKGSGPELDMEEIVDEDEFRERNPRKNQKDVKKGTSGRSQKETSPQNFEKTSTNDNNKQPEKAAEEFIIEEHKTAQDEEEHSLDSSSVSLSQKENNPVSSPAGEKGNSAEGLPPPQDKTTSHESEHENTISLDESKDQNLETASSASASDKNQGKVQKTISLFSDRSEKGNNRFQEIKKSKAPAKKFLTVITNHIKTKTAPSSDAKEATAEIKIESLVSVGNNIFKQNDAVSTNTPPGPLAASDVLIEPKIESETKIELPQVTRSSFEYSEAELKLACFVGTKMAKDCPLNIGDWSTLALLDLTKFRKFCQDLSKDHPEFYKDFFSHLALKIESVKRKKDKSLEEIVTLSFLFDAFTEEDLPYLTRLTMFSYIRMQPFDGSMNYFHVNFYKARVHNMFLLGNYLTLTFLPSIFNVNNELDAAIDTCLKDLKAHKDDDFDLTEYVLALPKESPYREKLLTHIQITDFPDDSIISQMPLPFKMIFEDMKQVSSAVKTEGDVPCKVSSTRFLHSQAKLDFSNPSKLKFFFRVSHYYYKVIHADTPEREITVIQKGQKIRTKITYNIDDTALWSSTNLFESELKILLEFYNAKNPSPQLQAFAYSIITSKEVLYFKIEPLQATDSFIKYSEAELKLACEVGTNMAKDCSIVSEDMSRPGAIPFDNFQKFCQDLSNNQSNFYQKFFSQFAVRMEALKRKQMDFVVDVYSLSFLNVFPTIMEKDVPFLTRLAVFAYFRMQPCDVKYFYHQHFYNTQKGALMTAYLTLSFLPSIFNTKNELDAAIDACLQDMKSSETKKYQLTMFALSLPKVSPYREKLLSHVHITHFPEDPIINQMPLPFKDIFEEMKLMSSVSKNESNVLCRVRASEIFHTNITFDFRNPKKPKFVFKNVSLFSHFHYKVTHAATPEREISSVELEKEVKEKEIAYDIDDCSIWSIYELFDDDLKILIDFYNAENPSPQLQAFAYSIINYKNVLYFNVPPAPSV